MRRKTAYRTRSKRFIKKIKTFLIYSTLSIVLVLFVSQVFLSNILEYSFSLADSGVGKDFKNADKYNLLLVNKNTLNEVLDVYLFVFDKSNDRIFSFKIDVHEENFYFNKSVSSIKFLFKNSDFNQDSFVQAFEKNYGILINHSMVFGGKEFEMYKKTIEGDIKLNEIGEVLSIKDVGIRNTFLMYSFSKDIQIEGRKEMTISSIFDLDKELKQIYLDSEIAEEQLSISVVNGANINGLGKRISRYVTNTGGRVVDLSTHNDGVKNSVILYKQNSKTLSYLSSILKITNLRQVTPEEINSLEFREIIKSDIVIVLGLDLPEDLR